jgi:quercetin dioxygenase-like cupin family protein
MNVIRVYCGDDGVTHFEDVDWPMAPTSVEGYDRSAELSAVLTMFASQPPGYFADWHPAPSRRLFVLISGSAEIGVSDGTTRRLAPGDVALLEDVAGPGHTMRVLGDTPRMAMHVTLEG